MLPLTLQFLVAMVACAISERQQMALEYKTEEVLVLKDILKAVTGKERIVLYRRPAQTPGRRLQGTHRQRARRTL